MAASLSAWQKVEAEHAASTASLRRALKASSQEVQAAQAACQREAGQAHTLQQQLTDSQRQVP